MRAKLRTRGILDVGYNGVIHNGGISYLLFGPGLKLKGNAIAVDKSGLVELGSEVIATHLQPEERLLLGKDRE